MKVTDHARAAALRRALGRLGLAQPGQRVLMQALDEIWRGEIGLRRDDLLLAIDQAVADGGLQHCSTLSGAALQLTARGLQGSREPVADDRGRAARLWAALNEHWNTWFVLARARRRSRQRLHFVGDHPALAPRRDRARQGDAPAPPVAPAAPVWRPPVRSPEQPSLRAPCCGQSRSTAGKH